MSYSLDFPINAGNPAPLRDIAAAVDQISQRTKLSAGELRIFDAAMQSSLKSGNTLKQALLELTAATPTLSKGINNLAKELLTLDTQAAKVGTTLQSHTIPQVTAAGAALRGLEGSMNIRAAERFLGTFSGIGTVLQAAFPVFGAMALLEVTGRMVEEVGKLYNAWDPVQRAEQKTLQYLKDSLPELKKLTAESEKLTEQARQREFGSGYVQRLREQSAAHDAAGDQRMIDSLRVQQAAAEARLKAGTVTAISGGQFMGPPDAQGKPTSFTGPGRPGSQTLDAQAADEELKKINAQLEDAILQKRVDQLKSEDAKAELSKSSLQRALERQRKIEEIERKTEQFKERSLALSDKTELGGFGTIGTLEEERRAMERRHAKEQADLEDQRRQNRMGGPDQVRVPDSVFDAQAMAIQANLALDRASMNRQIVVEARKEGDDQKILREEFANVSRESSGKRARELYDLTYGDMFKDAPGKFAADERIEDIQTGAKREGITRQAGKQQRMAQLSGAGVGTGYQQQLQLAKQLQELDLETALKIYESSGDVNKLRVDGAHAEADLLKATAEARLEAEVKILELREKQKDAVEGFAKGLFGAFRTGKTTGVNEFIKNEVSGYAETIVGNATGLLYKKIGGNPLSFPGQGTLENPTLLGSLLKGVGPFGIDPVKAAKDATVDPLSTALNLNEKSTTLLNKSIQQLINEITYITTKGASGSLPAGASASPDAFTLPGGIGVPGLGSLTSLPAEISAVGTIASGIGTGTSPEAFAAKLLQAGPTLLSSLDNYGFPGRNGSPGTDAGALVAPAVEAGAGTLQLVNGINTGGARGGLQAAAGGVAVATAGIKAAASISSSIAAIAPIAGPIGDAVAAGLTLATFLIGDPKQVRQTRIGKNIENQQYYSPDTITSMQDMNGNYSGYSRSGQVRSSPSISPYPSGISEPYFLYPTHPVLGVGLPGTNVPGTSGTVGAPRGTGVGNVNPGGSTVVNINAMDPRSFAQYISDNHQAVGDAMTRNLHSGGSAHLEVMRAALGMG